MRGNHSHILSRLDRNFVELEIRRAFTSSQLMTILEKNHITFLIVEHDPMLNEDAGEMVELHSSGPEAGLTRSHHSDIRLR